MEQAAADPTLFFQIASALIPGFLAGAIVIRPRDLPLEVVLRHRWLSLGIVAISLLAVVAESFAIAGALGADLGRESVYLIAFMLVGGTGVTAWAAASPWYRAVIGRSRLLLVGYVFFVASNVALLSNSVDLAKIRVDPSSARDDQLLRLKIDLIAATEDEIRARQRAGTISARVATQRLLLLATERRRAVSLQTRLVVRDAADGRP